MQCDTRKCDAPGGMCPSPAAGQVLRGRTKEQRHTVLITLPELLMMVTISPAGILSCLCTYGYVGRDFGGVLVSEGMYCRKRLGPASALLWGLGCFLWSTQRGRAESE